MKSSAERSQIAATKKEFIFKDSDFRKLIAIVHDRTGISIAEHKKDMMYGRIARRLRALDLKKFDDYIAFLESDSGEKEINDFVNAVTTNLTKFFREQHHFDHLRDVAIKNVITNKRDKRLRIWSAGCSSGMECYSIAMTVAETIPDMERWDIRILATDIDSNMLTKGEEGIYKEKEIEDIPAAYQKKYLPCYGEKLSGQHQIVSKLRNICFFKYLNFVDPWPVNGPFDIIFCRNVVIYFNRETQMQVFSNFERVLAHDGWLYIGHSENLSNVTDKFALIGKTIYRKAEYATA